GYSYCDLGQDYDATGTFIQSDKPISVFGIHNCAFIPFNRWACDHLEENLFPVETWGMNYVMTHTISKQNPQEPNLYRILSAFDNNTISFNPSSVQSTRTINKGQWFEFYTTADFEVKGTSAFSIAQYLVGEDYNGPNSHTSDMGDPAFSLGIPVEQYRNYYNFLTPATYTESYVNITAPTGQQVTLDGAAVSGFSSIGSGKYSVARIKLNPGQHSISSQVPVGIMVYGYARYTSYAYPGGLNLIPINK
ncbi:MAG: IgGFc-binding protein, partial [Deltaproteobacteria bacterium]|nr:IgGFc-binding protein [Deltaproteobacteria bacterium]